MIKFETHQNNCEYFWNLQHSIFQVYSEAGYFRLNYRYRMDYLAFYGIDDDAEYCEGFITLGASFWSGDEKDFVRITIPVEWMDMQEEDAVKLAEQDCEKRVKQVKEEAEAIAQVRKNREEEQQREQYERLKQKFDKPLDN